MRYWKGLSLSLAVLLQCAAAEAQRPPVVRSFTLLNADTGTAISGYSPIPAGAVLDVAKLPGKLSIRANVTSGTRSVRFGWQANKAYSLDATTPFTLRGEVAGKVQPVPLTPGNYSVSAVAASNPDGSGLRSTTLTLNFSVKTSSVIPTATPTLNTPVPTAVVTPTVAPSPTPVPTVVSPTPLPTVAPTLSPTITPTANPTVLPIPDLALWQDQMLAFGKKHCDSLFSSTPTADQQLAATYYDAQWVFYQIADYTRDYATWSRCAEAARAVFRDYYVVPNSGGIPGYWNFTHGLTQDFLRTGNLDSKNAELLIVNNAAYSRTTTPPGDTVGFELSRETAYTLMGFLNAEILGEPRNPRFDLLVGHALGHLDQWFGSKTASYVKSFMVGLTAHALISVYEATGDQRVIPALAMALDGLWDLNWSAADRAFRYMNVVNDQGDTSPAPDLNLLIAPAYAWLYYQTGNQLYRDRADQIFSGGVEQAYLPNPKQYNQNYRWSFEYVRLRNLSPRK